MTVEFADLADLNFNARLALSLDRQPNALLTTAAGRCIDLPEVATIWWRRPRMPMLDPQLPEDVMSFARKEWEHFLGMVEAFVPTRWVNSPTANRHAGQKGVQLTAAKAVGLQVPRTVITNDPQAVQSLVADGLPLVYKRIGTAPRPLTATQHLREADLDRLEVLPQCPAIFQEHIDARLDIRVTVIGDEIIATEIDSQSGSSPLDWRFDHSVPFRPHLLDDATGKRIKELMRSLGLVYGAIDLRLTPEGQYVFLEVNPNGQYLFIELLAGTPLTERIAVFLAGAS